MTRQLEGKQETSQSRAKRTTEEISFLTTAFTDSVVLRYSSSHHGGSSGMGRTSGCSEIVTSTKTPGVRIQSLGRFCLFFSVLLHVSRTTLCLSACLPYLLCVAERSRVSLALMIASHLLWISGNWGHSSSDWYLKSLSFLNFQIRWAASETRIRQSRLAPWRGFLCSFLNSARPQLSISPNFCALARCHVF